MKLLKILLNVILIIDQNKSSGKQVKLIYEKDVSEHCRRRVVPSVFLGKQVVEANARIMQFSRLEMPYSCFISVRTESGNNMVMVVQLMSDELKIACKTNEQLLVYEMGETFGGYWGPMSDSILTPEPQPLKIYTLKTTVKEPEPTEMTTEDDEEEVVTVPTKTSTSTAITDIFNEQARTGNYIDVEVPLLNVSIDYIPSREQKTEPPADFDETFNLHYDVTPIRGASYDRSVLPLVQLRVVDKGGRRNQEGEDTESSEKREPPKYELDIFEDFTPDSRLTLPPHNRTFKRRYHKQRYQPTKRLNFKKHKKLFHSQRQYNRRKMSDNFTRRTHGVTKYSFPTTLRPTEQLKYTRDSWSAIEDLLKNLNKTKKHLIQTTIAMKEKKFIDNISYMNLNKSVYLSPNLEAAKYDSTNDHVLSIWNTENIEMSTTEDYTSQEPTSIDWEETKLSSTEAEEDHFESMRVNTNKIIASEATTEKLKSKVYKFEKKYSAEDLAMTSNYETTSEVLEVSSKIHILNDDVKVTESNGFSGTTAIKMSVRKKHITSHQNLDNILKGSMVGHESWENIVQAAPEMAVLLNQTIAEVTTRDGGNKKDVTKSQYKNVLSKRKKRDIHSIAIENAQPHNLTTRKLSIATTEQSIKVADMQEFAELVELQDDESHGRVALRYLGQYVGPPLFSLCNITDSMKAHILLFNSSRIVISLTNFTLYRMVIILTAARALRSGEVRCPKARLECQVQGARVCMDSTVACDGVPNCGSYDIYDEDRLLCGHVASMQHNVYLAAFTLLAVLLTVVYSVHYWLKRCVPKVADAFFVYSDGVENVLYLDTIMRSPHDADIEPKLGYQSHLYGDDIYDEDTDELGRNSCMRFLRSICCCFCRDKHKKVDEMETSSINLNQLRSSSKKLYSFTELEIRKMQPTSKDTGVQTGDSLEMKPIDTDGGKQSPPLLNQPDLRRVTTTYDFSVKVRDSSLTLEEPLPEEHKDELSILKFFKSARSDSLTTSKPSPPELVAPKKKHRNSVKPQLIERIESPSERELEIHSYDRLATSEPGPSKKRMVEKEKALSLGSVNKHLRFDEVTTTIPPGRYIDEDEDGTHNTRRAVALTDRNRRNSRLEPIQESEEHGGGPKEHRYFWGSSKGKKAKNKAQVNLR